MTKTPEWLPDGSGIDPDSLDGDTVVETVTGFYRARRTVGPIVRVFADVTPPKPDPASATLDAVVDALTVRHGIGQIPAGAILEELRVQGYTLAALDSTGADQ